MLSAEQSGPTRKWAENADIAQCDAKAKAHNQRPALSIAAVHQVGFQPFE
jgi:hypothetical protein